MALISGDDTTILFSIFSIVVVHMLSGANLLHKRIIFVDFDDCDTDISGFVSVH